MIYDEKGTTNVATPVKLEGFEWDKLSHTLQRESYKNESKARNSYNNAYTVNYQSAMSELLNDPNLSANPEQLSKEISSLKQSIIPESAYEDMKLDFSADFDLKAQTYINKATANFNNIQEQKYKSSIFDKVMANNELMASAFSNSVNGELGQDDFVNYLRSNQENETLINQKDKNGLYVFTDTQRQSMLSQAKKDSFNALKDSFELMSDENKQAFISNIENDNFVVGTITDGNKTEPLNIKNVLDNKTYADIKRFASDQDKRIRSAKIQEHNLSVKESQLNFINEPTQENLDDIVKLNPLISEKAYEKYEELIKTQPNYEAVTEYDSYEKANTDVLMLANMPSDTPEAMQNLVEKSSSVILGMRKANESGKLGEDDTESLKQLAIKTVADKTFKDRIKQLPDISTIRKIGNIARDMTFFGEAYDLAKSKNNIEEISLKTSGAMLKAVSEDDFETAQQVYKKGLEDAIKAKYYFIPEMKQNLIPNESVININNRPYLFKGFGSEDILVEKQ